MKCKRVTKTDASIREEVPKGAAKRLELESIHHASRKKLSKDITALRKQVDKVKGSIKKELGDDLIEESPEETSKKTISKLKVIGPAKKRSLKKTLNEVESKLSKINKETDKKYE